MKKVIILGAGASKSYGDSKTKVRMPIAKDFFETFRLLDISENPWVLIGNIITYISERNNADILDFLDFSEDIEILHSEIQEELYIALSRGDFFSHGYDVRLLKAFNELIFLFVNVINEIQNGKISKAHINLAKQLMPEDSIITFNWDTLMDRALKAETSWDVSDGYYISPTAIYRNEWVNNTNAKARNTNILLKLHGSSNWLTSHIQPSNDGTIELSQETNVEDFYVYEYSIEPYPTYAGRYMDGYEEFSYGYYPPNLPLKGKKASDGYIYARTRINFPNMPVGTSSNEGLVSMPLIIPPVKKKEYDLFGSLFKNIWEKAEDELMMADEIHIIGYSFPITDIRTDKLFKKAFNKRNSIPQIIILNPSPEPIVERFIYDYGIPVDHIKILKQYFDNTYSL
ncbi:MAG: hypothetical protein BGO34_08295 [Bacteroidia bacterium 44-10]|nr:MAG: hypothetical protein BGO34_08295 [Bacteroidia bacterium 44-10]